MLGKLLKYEFKYMSKICLPTLLIMLGLCIAGRGITLLVSLFAADVVTAALETLMFSGAYIAIIASSVVITIVTVVRFYRNMTRDEGYLMFTLPVSTSQLILSKLIAAFAWQILGAIASVIAMAVSIANSVLWRDTYSGYGVVVENTELDFMFGDMLEYFSPYAAHAVVFVLIFIVMALVSSVMGILMYYAAIALGQLVRGSRIIGAVAAYVGLNFASQIVMSIVAVPVMSAMTRSLVMGEAPQVGNVITQANTVMLIMTLVALLVAATLYLITHSVLSKRLNLE